MGLGRELKTAGLHELKPGGPITLGRPFHGEIFPTQKVPHFRTTFSKISLGQPYRFKNSVALHATKQVVEYCTIVSSNRTTHIQLLHSTASTTWTLLEMILASSPVRKQLFVLRFLCLPCVCPEPVWQSIIFIDYENSRKAVCTGPILNSVVASTSRTAASQGTWARSLSSSTIWWLSPGNFSKHYLSFSCTPCGIKACATAVHLSDAELDAIPQSDPFSCGICNPICSSHPQGDTWNRGMKMRKNTAFSHDKPQTVGFNHAFKSIQVSFF